MCFLTARFSTVHLLRHKCERRIKRASCACLVHILKTGIAVIAELRYDRLDFLAAALTLSILQSVFLTLIPRKPEKKTQVQF